MGNLTTAQNSVESHIVDLCDEYGALYEIEGDPFHIIPRRIKVKLNNDHPIKQLETDLVALCEEHDLKFDVLFDDFDVLFDKPSWLEIVVSKGIAFDQLEVDMVERCLKSGNKFLCYIGPELHTYEFADAQKLRYSEAF